MVSVTGVKGGRARMMKMQLQPLCLTTSGSVKISLLAEGKHVLDNDILAKKTVSGRLLFFLYLKSQSDDFCRAGFVLRISEQCYF